MLRVGITVCKVPKADRPHAHMTAGSLTALRLIANVLIAPASVAVTIIGSVVAIPGDRDRRAVLPPDWQAEPVPPLVMWTVYEHPKDCPGDYVARKFVITEDFYRSSNESISSRSLRDVRNLLRSLYPGLIQLKRPPDDEPNVVEVWL